MIRSCNAESGAQNVWHPKAIIMVGIAFGRDPAKQKIGDVLVASQIIPYEQQRVGEQVIFRGPIPPSNTVLLNRFENAPTWRSTRPDGKDCALLVGPFLFSATRDSLLRYSRDHSSPEDLTIQAFGTLYDAIERDS